MEDLAYVVMQRRWYHPVIDSKGTRPMANVLKELTMGAAQHYDHIF